jgi:hypothetical protein
VSYTLMSGILTDAAQRSDHIRGDAMRIARHHAVAKYRQGCILLLFGVMYKTYFW